MCDRDDQFDRVDDLRVEGVLEVRMAGDVLIASLARPEKRNALNDASVLAVERVADLLPANIRAVVLEGMGEHFSGGLDLNELRERNVTEGIHHSRMWHRVFEKLQFGRVPIVAVLKGAVIGGGLELALAAHIRVAETTAFYALPEGQRGIFVGGGAAVRLPRVIGVDRMADMMLTGRTYGAEEGLRLGLSQYLVGRGEGLAKALELAQRIAKNATITNFAVIQALPQIAAHDRTGGFVMEALMSAIAQAEPDAKERVRAFLEKRAQKVEREGT